ncbi:hypothetical protein Skr01_56990 [Sphaerisporangium krabiense]|uniref:NTP pyrophosphohydrolase MazG putative catalytic core domain-containing protein n=1 Tax=Sphaerisporangium krabiense TaxID=763782 RepID=A0A7W8Z9H1_9ACTN|nr:MazG-like family protein [Sphaerisporangium krabiense]MBB5629533.1 hypothetical protein [Sphaerisporangium krabiense]GII65614.1 hypothetical protein Skr01_56990 [Sphaerisporangium krabiense]
MTDQWQTLASLVDWLNRSNGTSDHETAIRVMKVGEEFGEAVAAYVGMTGQNPRKGITHSAEDVAGELVDVAVTALVALHSFTRDPRGTFEAKLARIADRVATAEKSP